MRILAVSMDRGIRPGGTKGAAIHLTSLVTAWSRAGHDVVLLGSRPAEDGFPEDIDVVTAAPADVDDAVRGLGAFDVVHERYSLGSLTGLQLARKLDVPLTLEVNAPLVAEATLHRPETVKPEHEDVEHRLFREADTVVAVSRPLASMIAVVRGREDVVVVPNGCDATSFSNWMPHRRRRQAIAFLGHPKPWHGAEELPAVLRALRDGGVETSLEIIGGGAGAEAVRESARALDVDDCVTVTGPLPHAQACARLTEVRVAVAPYPRIDPFYFCPIKVIESMAAGCALAVSDLGDIGELAGGFAALLPAGDSQSLADSLASLLGDVDGSECLGRAARERALSRFTWDAVARRVLAAGRHARSGEGV